jgi:hypothetical protein
MKKKWLILLVVALGLLIIGGVLLFSGKKAKNTALLTPTPAPAITEIPLEERPYVRLIPRTDGKELTLEISRLKGIQAVEYELTYLSDDLSRGVIGSIDLKSEEEISRKLTLGSCSRNVCKYDENVTEGSLLLRFRGEKGVSRYTSDFRLQKGGSSLISLDEKFSLEGKISSSSYYIVMSTMGLPGEVPGSVEAGPYGIFTEGSTVIKNGKVAFPDLADRSVNIYLWTGKAWQKAENGLTSSLNTFVALTSE